MFQTADVMTQTEITKQALNPILLNALIGGGAGAGAGGLYHLLRSRDRKDEGSAFKRMLKGGLLGLLGGGAYGVLTNPNWGKIWAQAKDNVENAGPPEMPIGSSPEAIMGSELGQGGLPTDLVLNQTGEPFQTATGMSSALDAGVLPQTLPDAAQRIGASPESIMGLPGGGAGPVVLNQ